MASRTQPVTPPRFGKRVAPSHARYWVIFFAVTLAILAYIDRVCISMMAPEISKDLNFDRAAMGWVFSSFAIAYALFEIPGGYWGDKIGPRRVLMRIVLWWSAFTAFTGATWNWLSMIITRFLFGAGEAGCFPNLTKSFTIWLPVRERVQAQGIMWMFARWGGAFTPPLVAYVYGFMGWRMSFLLFGALGLFWAAAFYWWFRDNPKDHPAVNEAELELLADGQQNAGGHHDVPWAKLAQSPTVLLLWLQYFLLSFPWYFYITWLPTYLRDGRHVPADHVQWYAMFPLAFGGLGSMACGLLSGHLVKTMSVKSTRRIMACFGFFGAAVMMVVSINTADPLYGMIFMGLASFCNDLVMPGAWGTCMDVGGKYAGTLSGSMNMMGNMAGFVAPALAGYILRATNDNFNVILYMMAGAYLLGTLCWPFIDPVTPIDQD